jgi:lipopolysaccharide transport system permease protein
MDFLVALGLLILMLVYFGVKPTSNLFVLPVLLVFLTLAGAGMSILFSVLTVTFPDLRVAITVIMQIWFFATPIVYPASIVPASLRAFYGLNPMVGLVEAFRWCLLGLPKIPETSMLITSAATIVTLFIASLSYFRRVESRISDIL